MSHWRPREGSREGTCDLAVKDGKGQCFVSQISCASWTQPVLCSIS